MMLAPALLRAGWFLPSIDEVEVGRVGAGWNSGYANQGVAADGTHFYTSRGFIGQQKWLIPYAEGFSFREPVIELTYDSRLRHVGDIAIGRGLVFVPVSDYIPGLTLDYAAIGVYSAGDDTLLEVVDLSTRLSMVGPGDLAGLEVYEDRLLLVEYQIRASGITPRIWRAGLIQPQTASAPYAGIEFDASDFVDTVTYAANGAAVCGDFLLVTHSERPPAEPGSVDEHGYLDVYVLEDILSGLVAYPVATFTFDAPEIHAEGVTYFDGQLWTAQDGWVIRLESPDLEAYFSNEAPVVKHWDHDGSRRSDWFGWFAPEAVEPFLYHFEHGLLYLWHNRQDAALYYDYGLGSYVYTSRSFYPWTYLYAGEGGWFYYFNGGLPGARWFYDAKEDIFLREDEFPRHKKE